MKPSGPGPFSPDAVRDGLGSSLARAAEVPGGRSATLAAHVDGKTSPSPEMAVRTEEALGRSPDTRLGLQARHDGEAMRARASEIDVRRHEPA